MTENANSPDTKLFWLRTEPHPSTPDSTRFSNLYMRLHGGGVSSVMMMPSPPKFLRSQLSESGKVLFTSWKHPGREWGLSFSGRQLSEGEKKAAGWHAVEIVENQGLEGFVFKTGYKDENELILNAEEDKQNLSDDQQEEWCGWMVCEWKYGHPQLFWVTGNKVDLPPFCERVVLVRQYLTEEDHAVQASN